MLRETVNRLRGQVWLRVESAFPERVLNLCGARDLAFWDLTWESPTEFTCRLSRKDWHALRQATKNLDCTLTVVRKEGVPYFLTRFQNRTALVTGLVACTLGLFLGSFFIWDFQVKGNETVPTEDILRALEKSGVTLGTFGLSLDGEDIRNHVLLEIPELSWITVNVSGCRAEVQVRERIMAPELLNEQIPTNVVARRDGLILKVQALNGVTCVLPGSAVTEGQLLISGIEDMETFGARMLRGEGTAQARTWYALQTVIPLNLPEKQYTGKEKNAVSLALGKRRVKFFSNSSIEGMEYDKITNRKQLSLIGVSLPITIITETFRFYETISGAWNLAEAETAGETVLDAYLHSLVDPYGSVSSTLCSASQVGDTLLVTLTAECREQIGKSIPIYTEESDG